MIGFRNRPVIETVATETELLHNIVGIARQHGDVAGACMITEPRAPFGSGDGGV